MFSPTIANSSLKNYNVFWKRHNYFFPYSHARLLYINYKEIVPRYTFSPTIANFSLKNYDVDVFLASYQRIRTSTLTNSPIFIIEWHDFEFPVFSIV